MGFSVLLVDYKSIQMTLDYIGLCNKYLKSDNQIQYIIVDNTEDASDLQFIKESHELKKVTRVDNKPVYLFTHDGIEVHITAAMNNGGYAKGNNLAAKVSAALFPSNNYIVSNNDILFDETYNLDIIEDEIKNNDVAVIGPNVVNPDGTGANPFNRPDENFIMFTLFLNTLLPRKIKQRPNDELYTFSGCFWIFSKKYFDLAQGFDERTFLYFEEQIMSERIQKVGGKFKYQDDFKVIHNHVNHKKSPIKESKMLRYFYDSMRIYTDSYLNVNPGKKILSRIIYEILNVLYIIERAIIYIVR